MEQPPTSKGDGESAPAEDASLYSPREAARLKKKFKRVAEEQRRRTDSTAKWGLAILAACFLYVVLPKALEPFLFVIGLGLLAKTIHSVWRGPRLKCPGCAGDLDPTHDEAFGHYCPDCGNRSLKQVAWSSLPRCGACNLAIAKGSRGGPYRIRACTHCGLWLDDEGL